MRKRGKFILLAVPVCLLVLLALWLGWSWYDENVDRSGWREHGGVTVYTDFYGDPVSGWHKISGELYYFDVDHAAHTGWLTTEDGTYYFDPDGKMHTLWLDTAEGRCYLGEDGVLRTNWQTIEDQRYYFSERGILQTGWLQIGSAKHYFHENGALAAGWLKTESGTYFLDDNGSPVTGWLTWQQERYCFDENGVLYTGWQTLDGSRYYFSASGAAHAGWLEMEQKRYYFGEDCAMVTLWQEIDDRRYYFSEDGILQTGWLEQGEYRYYLLSDGTVATGRQEINADTYYFTPDGIWVLLVNPWNPLSDTYAPELVETEDGFLVEKQCLDSLNAMMADMRAEGLLPMFSSTYRTKTHQTNIWNKYVNRYMADGYSREQANAMTADFVAVPGTSEHHTGLAMDIVGYDYFYNGNYGSTKAVQAWLAEHCWEYGFILRYTEEKRPITGFAAETWHFRYVGVAVSMDMKDSGLCLEEYLGAADMQG
ncbi:MAG: D-alanyl-D-alanine carboxypeptidase family protein [Oscillospiraceae bacterium]|nr:D-alanyl-D-alanine carboxypeptidase family protein [Oscillospiraceae bacterium]